LQETDFITPKLTMTTAELSAIDVVQEDGVLRLTAEQPTVQADSAK
jgi:hypothetical protein